MDTPTTKFKIGQVVRITCTDIWGNPEYVAAKDQLGVITHISKPSYELRTVLDVLMYNNTKIAVYEDWVTLIE